MNLRLFACALAFVAAPAGAHAFLDHANPGAGAVLHAAPKSVLLVFSDNLDAATSMVVLDGIGHSVAAGRTVVSGNRAMVPLRPLAPGSYRVVWHAVSDDGHKTEGAYGFMVKP